MTQPLDRRPLADGSATFGELLQRRLSRRELLAHSALLALPSVASSTTAVSSTAAVGSRDLAFQPIIGSREDRVLVSPGHSAQVLIGWGDPLFAGTPGIATRGLIDGSLLRPGSAAAQERQFGYNCDAIAFLPLERSGRRGVLCVNHEYCDPRLMFPSRRQSQSPRTGWSADTRLEAMQTMMAAHGVSILEIALEKGVWKPVIGSPLSRRITGRTPIEIHGPARGHPLLRTAADPSGTHVLGTLANCSGGKTPWGTYLTAEENIEDYFGSFPQYRDSAGSDARTVAAYARFPTGERNIFGWEALDRRFDLSHEPREALRFGWIVEIDPHNARSPIRKRTALGRFCHESAASFLTRDQRAAVYMGDDTQFEYIYKFISRDRVNLRQTQANRELLDHGVLHVARLDADGTGRWLPLVHGEGPLTARQGFADQGEVVIRARAAADLLGATPMDRPEDIAIHPQTGRLYVALTNNDARTVDPVELGGGRGGLDRRPNAANPRPSNRHGHIVEIIEDGADAAALAFRWNVFLLAGDPQSAAGRFLTDATSIKTQQLGADDTYFAGYAEREKISPIGSPDNLGFDPAGNLWIVTDGEQPHGANNGAFAVPVVGAQRGHLRQFMSAPVGAEVCGCEFTPDGETLFLSIQHPGEGGTLEEPRSQWPDGSGLPARPSVVAIRRDRGGPVGS